MERLFPCTYIAWLRGDLAIENATCLKLLIMLTMQLVTFMFTLKADGKPFYVTKANGTL